MSYVNRYREMLEAKRKPFAVEDGQIFVRKQNWIAPVGPAAQRYSLNYRQAKRLQQKLGGWWVSWTEGFGSSSETSAWHAIVCRKFVELGQMPAKRRYEVNRGLKNCQVRRVDAAEIAQNGYEVYAAALHSYEGGKASLVPTPEQFATRVLTDTPFADIKHHWAVYHKEQMVAFAQCYLYDRTEVDYTLIKIHPGHLDSYPVYALLYSMNEFYLGEQGFEYVNDGWRSILHETGVQEFLISKFNFERSPARLCVRFKQPLATLLRFSGPLHPILARMDKRVKATLELHRLSS